MIGFVMAELKLWRKEEMTKAVSSMALALAAAAIAGPLNPVFEFIAAAAIFVIAGWREGRSYEQGPGQRRYLLTSPLRLRKIIAARLLASWSIFLALLFAASPILLSSAIAWGVSAEVVAACALCWAAAYALSSAMGFASAFVLESAEGILGAAALAAWVILSFFVKWLMPANPFLQLWNLLNLEPGPGIFASVAAELALAALLVAASAPSIDRLRRVEGLSEEER
jgi:hypothetical protein